MRKGSRFIAAVAVAAVAAFGFVPGQAANATGCTATATLHVKYTAAGSCKDPSHGWQLHCGTTGTVVGALFSVHANLADATGRALDPSNGGDPTKIDGFQIEACGDSGNGNTQGRLLLLGSRANQGIRAVLDSDPDQAFPAGYDIVQVASAAQGIYCLAQDGTGDGYQASWSNPGTANGPTCIQNLAPAAANTQMLDAATKVALKQFPAFTAQINVLRASFGL